MASNREYIYKLNFELTVRINQVNRITGETKPNLLLILQEKIDSLVELARHSRGGNSLPTCPRGSATFIG